MVSIVLRVMWALSYNDRRRIEETVRIRPHFSCWCSGGEEKVTYMQWNVTPASMKHFVVHVEHTDVLGAL
jgi:hypothetical protein